jgi:hypothetical protein
VSRLSIDVSTALGERLRSTNRRVSENCKASIKRTLRIHRFPPKQQMWLWRCRHWRGVPCWPDGRTMHRHPAWPQDQDGRWCRVRSSRPIFHPWFPFSIIIANVPTRGTTQPAVLNLLVHVLGRHHFRIIRSTSVGNFPPPLRGQNVEPPHPPIAIFTWSTSVVTLIASCACKRAGLSPILLFVPLLFPPPPLIRSSIQGPIPCQQQPEAYQDRPDRQDHVAEHCQPRGHRRLPTNLVRHSARL